MPVTIKCDCGGTECSMEISAGYKYTRRDGTEERKILFNAKDSVGRSFNFIITKNNLRKLISTLEDE